MEVRQICKATLFKASAFALVFLAGCTQNPLTGQKEFTGLMSPQQEQSIGASQHNEIIKQYGGEYKNPTVQNYVTRIGNRMAQFSDRQDVQYRFTVLDSPIVNAFALPGGYVYITRGTLAVANSEAELAAVLGHEIGHIAGRHQAARYSQGVLTQLGASVLSAAIGMPAATQAIGLGSNLYMSSYSRDQETQADQLGVRYLSRAGYDTIAMSDFLRNMNLYQTAEAQIEGKKEKGFSYLSSHPDTAGRVVVARAEAQKFPNPQKADNGEKRYLASIEGMSYGESAAQGFERDGTFYHPDIGFAFDVPPSFKIDNKPERIAIEGRDNTVLVLDIASGKGVSRAEDYVSSVWLKGRGADRVEAMDVNNMRAATVSVPVNINNQPADVRLIAVEWGDTDFVRMQILIPHGASRAAVDDMKRISYSFRKMSSRDRNVVQPYRIELVTARVGDTLQSLASRMSVTKGKVELFAAMNGLTPAMPVQSGKTYKVVQ